MSAAVPTIRRYPDDPAYGPFAGARLAVAPGDTFDVPSVVVEGASPSSISEVEVRWRGRGGEFGPVVYTSGRPVSLSDDGAGAAVATARIPTSFWDDTRAPYEVACTVRVVSPEDGRVLTAARYLYAVDAP